MDRVIPIRSYFDAKGKTMNRVPKLMKPNEGQVIGVVGDLYRFLAVGDDAEGRYATIEAIVPPRVDLPLISTVEKKNPSTSLKARLRFRSERIAS